MRYSLGLGLALLMCCGVLSGAQSQPNPDAEKSSTTTASSITSESFPKVCSQTNPPPCATAPRAIFAPSPEFSEQGPRRDFKGVCVLSVVVETDGSTSHVRVMKAPGMGLDEQAIKAVKTWKFKPATLNGKPVAVLITVEVTFGLY
jgi:TonB family protein